MYEGIGIALFYDQINILAEDVTFWNLHLWEIKTGSRLRQHGSAKVNLVWLPFDR